MTDRHYFKELRLQQFRALSEVARHGTFTAAAKALRVSRTSVWQQMRALEDEFGTELVVVHGHHSDLTPEGRVLLELIDPLVDAFDGVKAAFQDRQGNLKRRLIVATTASLLDYELRGPIETFRKKHPDVSISLIDRPSSAALELLERGKADVAVVGRVAEHADTPALKSEPLTEYPFVLACPKRHPLVGRGRFDLKEVVRYPLLCPSVGTNSRQRIDMVLARENLTQHTRIALDSHNATLLLTYVGEGFGVALTSISPVLQARLKGKLSFRDVSAQFGSEEILLVQRVRRFALPHVASFVEIVRKRQF